MIDEKVLIAEINKRIKALKNKKKEIHSKAWDWSIDAEINDYKSILSFIGSLQEEHVVEQNLSNVQRNEKERKEPVSEDLEEAAEKAAVETFFVSPKWTEIRKEQFKAGANWQKEQDQSIIELAEDHAMLAGMEKMREQMMKDAMEVPLYSDGDFLTVDYDFSHEGFKAGDKVKLIIIKED